MKHLLRYIAIGILWALLPSSPAGAAGHVRVTRIFDVANSDTTFTTISWPDGTLTEVPREQLVYRVGPDYAASRLTVRMTYPEYTEVSASDKRVLRRLGYMPVDSIQYETEMGVSRKEGILHVGFVPIIRRGNKWMRLTSAKFCVERRDNIGSLSLQQASSTTQRYAAHSVLASGRWLKVRVSQEGVYALTSSLLSAYGMSDLSRVKVYGYGGRPENDVISYGTRDGDYDDLEEIPLYRRSGDVLFYAEGTRRWSSWTYSDGVPVATYTNNPYSRYSYYFITQGDSAMTMETDSSAVTPLDTLTSFPEHVVIDNDEYSWYTSGRNLYENYNYGESGATRNYTMATPGCDNSSSCRVSINFTAFSSSVTRASLSLNGKELGSFNLRASGEYDHAIAATRRYTVTGLQPSNTLTVQSTSGHDARLDNLEILYMREMAMTGNVMPFSHYSTSASLCQMTGSSSNTQIWRIGTPGHPMQRIPTTLSGSRLQFALADPSQRYVAVNVAANYSTPQIVGEIYNQDLHADSAADMVIIIPESGKLEAQAQRLANYHKEHDGLRVRVVSADYIYNEFSSGTPDAGAYRRYLKMLYDRAATASDMPRYLLLMGACVWDNRMITSETSGLDPADYLLCYESAASLNEVDSYVTDDYFGLLDDGEGSNILRESIDLGIGRLPVTTADEAKIIVDKIIAYADNTAAGAWQNDIYMLADDGDANEHMNDEDESATMLEQRYPEMHVKRIYWDAYPRVSTATGQTYPEAAADIKNAMNKGALIVNYSGHGNPTQVSHERVLELADFEAFSSARVPLWVVASCEITPYDMLEETIGESALLNPKGAAIAFYSAARAVYSNYNSMLNRYFMYYVLGQDDSGRRYTLGDAAMMTKVNLVSNTAFGTQKDYSYNKVKYALIGDPALTLWRPTYRVVVDSINSKSLSADSVPQLKAGSVATVSGHIEDAQGTALPDFSGTISLTLYDSQDTITCRNNDGSADDPFVYAEYTKTLYSGSDSVRAGRYRAQIPVPLDIKYTGLNGRLNLYAVNAQKTITANGNTYSFTVGGTAPDATADSLGPSIYLYLNNPDFQDGGTVNSTPYFFANLSDSDGINATGNGVGHDIELIIDGDESTSYVLNDYYANDFGSYTSGTVAFQIPSLSEGRHSLYFRAWDMKNNSSSRRLDFVVKQDLKPSILRAYLSQNPASTSTTFIISYDRPLTETNFTIDVYDCFGRRWWHHSESSSSNGIYTIPWNLSTDGGIALPDGLYLYRVRISTADSKQSTKTEKLVIHRQ